MRAFKQFTAEIRDLAERNAEELRSRLFDFLFYSPKFPIRSEQQVVLNLAKRDTVTCYDRYFNQNELNACVYRWEGGGPLVLLTHGWASKAADFAALIDLLYQQMGYTVIAFDAPGNGSSEGRLTNLTLYIATIEEILKRWGDPEIFIGHSLGAMANIYVYKSISNKPKLMLNLAPLVNLVDYFNTMMRHTGVQEEAIKQFYTDFTKSFQLNADYFDLNEIYDYEASNHWIFYDEQDEVSPYPLLEQFLHRYPAIQTKAFNGVGHHRLLKDPTILKELEKLIYSIT